MVQPSSSPGSVDTLFESWLEEFERGGEDFEAFVALHAEQAKELRRLFLAWRRLCSALPESASAPGLRAASPPDLAGESRERAGRLGASLADGSMAEGRRGGAAGQHPELQAGALVGDYRLVRPLGAGGMGQVWEAEQVSLGRRVALKMLRHGRGFVGGERLLHEARAAGRINHPGIVPVFAAGEAGGVDYVVQQIVGDGTTLADLIEQRRRTGQPSALRLAALFIDIAEALHAAHEQDILHRDLKPRNILIDPDGRPRVSDFGLALRVGDIGSAGLVGTCAYMSPEQAEGGLALDRRSDVFSLGAVLYEALTLERPFGGDTITDVLAAVRDHRPADLSRLARDVPGDLAAVCMKALEKDPAARYRDMRAFVADLRRLLAHEPVLARRTNAAGRTWRWSRRHPARAVALLLGGASLVIVAALLARESNLRHEAESRASEARAQGYLANLRAAAAHMQRGNPVEARQRLSACAPELRGW
ncbi:MAG TPA: serine/threonine-protein kinase, partial [Planctomycetota bacterium]|nr:serine/threonine-protein kinase [Planctomycetota bacterium]